MAATDRRPEWLKALQRMVSSTPAAPDPNRVQATFATVRSLNPLRIALDSDPTTTLSYAPPCVNNYPTKVGQRVWVQTYGRQVVIVGVLAKTSPDLPVGAGGVWFGPIGKAPALPWMIADGAAISRADFPEAFALWGETFGPGNGSTTFNLPDFRGRTLVGADTSQPEFDTVGEHGGSKTHTLSVNEMPAHGHGAPGFRFYVESTNGAWRRTSTGGHAGTAGEDGVWRQRMAEEGTQNTGGGQPHNNLQPYRVARYMVKVL